MKMKQETIFHFLAKMFDSLTEEQWLMGEELKASDEQAFEWKEGQVTLEAGSQCMERKEEETKEEEYLRLDHMKDDYYCCYCYSVGYCFLLYHNQFLNKKKKKKMTMRRKNIQDVGYVPGMRCDVHKATKPKGNLEKQLELEHWKEGRGEKAEEERHLK